MRGEELVASVKRKFTAAIAARSNRKKIRTEDDGDVFAREILEGLQSTPKKLPSKYLYDSVGDELFKKITTLPEYYVTRCEEEILRTRAPKIAALANRWKDGYRLIELGPGDGIKTKILLDALVSQPVDFTYHPIDISTNVLQQLGNNLRGDYPSLSVQPLAADYMAALEEIAKSRQPSFILFMGGNIGNYTKDQAAEFLGMLAARMHSGDLLLCGFDLKKDPAVIYRAYNDSQGITRSFTFNLLRRLNREMSADFDPGSFLHYPTYDPQSGAMKSYLISKREQTVTFGKPAAEISFGRWEPVLTEVSNKYDLKEISRMSSAAGLTTETLLHDRKRYYVNAIFKK